MFEKEEILNDLKKIFNEPILSVNIHRLVLDYLNHYAYLGTLESFINESGINKIEENITKNKEIAPNIMKKHELEYIKFSPL